MKNKDKRKTDHLIIRVTALEKKEFVLESEKRRLSITDLIREKLKLV